MLYRRLSGTGTVEVDGSAHLAMRCCLGDRLQRHSCANVPREYEPVIGHAAGILESLGAQQARMSSRQARATRSMCALVELARLSAALSAAQCRVQA